VQEVESTLTNIRREYPGALVKPSSFDAFMADVLPVKSALPTVELEVSDTWIYGTPSDPLKVAQHRAIQRAWIQCMHAGDPRCAVSDPTIQNMTFFLLKAPEHTWGTPGISGWGGADDYNVSRFRSELSSEKFARAAASYAEQRLFNELAVRALEEANHPLSSIVRREVQQIEEVSIPDLLGFQELPLDSLLFAKNSMKIGFRHDGAITTLQDGSVRWASTAAPLAALVYQTFNDTEWKPFTYAYLNDHQMQAGFCKPGSNNFSESALWRPTLRKLLVKGMASDFQSAMLVMDMPVKAREVYGAPHVVYLRVTPAEQGFELDLISIGKLPTMIGESLMLTFRPAPLLDPIDGGSAWRLDKLGQSIDPEGVQDGGNQFAHGVWKGATVTTESGAMLVESLDAGNMNPMTDDFPVGNPLPASYKEATARAGKGLSRLAPGSVHGMAVNLHNNLWNTNYPLFYPYFDPRLCSSPLSCKNSNSLWRFRLAFHPKAQIYI